MKRLRCGTAVALLVGGTMLGCATVGPPPQAFADVQREFWMPLTAAFDRQARGLDDAQWKALYAKHIANPKVPVNIALIDVDRGPNATVVQSVHSAAITRVMGGLFCEAPSSPACRIQSNVTPRPMDGAASAGAATGIDTPYFLTFDQLTAGLRGALDRKKPEDHLIINLGVAWDPAKTDPDGANIKPIVDQLVRASCMGAVVVAPAGNKSGSTGAMFPAVLEAQRAPSADDCAKAGFPQTQKQAGEVYAPLVYAVGALDARDRRVEIMRPFGQPRLSAYGLAVSVGDAANQTFTQPLSGTSMSAAIVSGIAASVWAARADLDGHQVMDLIYQGGVPLDDARHSGGARTDFCVGQPFGPCREWTVHRAFLCGALAKALPDEKLSCVNTPSKEAKLSELFPFPTAPTNPQVPAQRCTISGCDVQQGPVAIERAEGAVPQPDDPICPTCTLTRSNVQGAVVWPAGAPNVMASVTVGIWTDIFSPTPAVNYNLTPWTPTGSPFSIPMGVPPGSQAALMTVVDANGTHYIPLIVPIP